MKSDLTNGKADSIFSRRSILLHRTVGIFLFLSVVLGASFWLGHDRYKKTLETVYYDPHRLDALRTFESAIVAAPLAAEKEQWPRPEFVREKLKTVCGEEVAKVLRKNVSDQMMRNNPCAHTNQANELACNIGRINKKLEAMATGQASGGKMLATVNVVSLERWAQAIEATRSGAGSIPSNSSASPGIPTQDVPTAANLQGQGEGTNISGGKVSCKAAFEAAHQLASGGGKMLELLTWRDRIPESLANRFARDQQMTVRKRVVEQGNPWGGLSGCVYLSDSQNDGKSYFMTDRAQSNRKTCVSLMPAKKPDLLIGAWRKDGTLDKSDPAWFLPDTLEGILVELDQIRQPSSKLYGVYTENRIENPESLNRNEKTDQASISPDSKPRSSQGRPLNPTMAEAHGGNRIERNGKFVDVGFSTHLTIVPTTQSLVQQMARCYTGDTAACALAGLGNDNALSKFTAQMYEGAAARMVAVTVIDVASGRIEALGSGHTDCYRQDHESYKRDLSVCPDLPFAPAYKPDRLRNHALFTDAMPASTIKPIMALGFLQDETYRKKLMTSKLDARTDFTVMQNDLKVSYSVGFLNRMFCQDHTPPWVACERPKLVQSAAAQLGWNLGCTDTATPECGGLDVLFGRPLFLRVADDKGRSPMSQPITYGRLLTQPPKPKDWVNRQLITDFSYDPVVAQTCHDGSKTEKGQKWRKCKGGHFVNLESEGWGQGNAQANVVGVAGMLGRLAAAANGMTEQRFPHLVDKITDFRGEKFDLAVEQLKLNAPVKINVASADAMHILAGMQSHMPAGVPKGSGGAGTAFSACKNVFSEPGRCNKIDWLAGKTGTPPYSHDSITLLEIKKRCGQRGAGAQEGENQTIWKESCSRERPYKWYVAAFKTDSKGPYTKVIAVLAERNWHRTGNRQGKVNAPGDDEESNISAELAFRIMKKLRPSDG